MVALWWSACSLGPGYDGGIWRPQGLQNTLILWVDCVLCIVTGKARPDGYKVSRKDQPRNDTPSGTITTDQLKDNTLGMDLTKEVARDGKVRQLEERGFPCRPALNCLFVLPATINKSF